MGNKHTLFIHMGIHKTGTTALQYFLYENREKLKKYGWYYPDLSSVAGVPVVDFINGQALLWRMEEGRKAFWYTESWNYIRKCLEDYDVIVSCEDFYGTNISHFLSEAKKEYDQIQTIIYLRRQDLQFEARWNQCIKDANTVLPIEEYPVSAYYYDYWERLEDICSIIGQENMHVRVYEKKQLLHGDIIDDFFREIGVSLDRSEFVPPISGNPRLDGIVLKEKRLFNVVSSFCWEGDREQYRLDFVSFFLRANEIAKERGHIKKDFGYLTKKCREEILEKYADGNVRIARKYLNREELFFDKCTDIPYFEMQDTKLEEQLADIFVPAFCEVIRELHDLKDKLADIMQKNAGGGGGE